jgi:hypothetical protein
MAFALIGAIAAADASATLTAAATGNTKDSVHDPEHGYR